MKEEQKTYICAHCGEEFGYGQSEEEANAEYEKNFPMSHKLGVETDLVCDDCYKAMMKEYKASDFENDNYK